MNKDLIVKQINNELTQVIKEDNKEISITENEYNNLQKKGNEINEELILQVNDHEEKSIIHGEKDIKKCYISFERDSISKKIIDKSIDYCFNSLLMETVFIEVEQNDISTIKQLYKMNYENLGIVDDKITFIIEKEEKNLGSVANGYNKKH